MTILEFLSSSAGIVAEICITVLIVTFAALIATGKVKLKKLKAGGTEVEFNNEVAKKVIEKQINNSGIKSCPELVDSVMKIIKREFDDSITEIESNSEKYQDLIRKNDSRTVDKAIRNYLMTFPKLFGENDTRNNLDTNDLLELYLTKDINSLIMDKLQELYNDPETKHKEEIELNGVAEDLAKEIVVSLKYNIRNYRMLANTTDELNKLFDQSARELLDYLKGAIQGYIKYSESEQQERLLLIEKRNDTISDQISNVINGGVNVK